MKCAWFQGGLLVAWCFGVFSGCSDQDYRGGVQDDAEAPNVSGLNAEERSGPGTREPSNVPKRDLKIKPDRKPSE